MHACHVMYTPLYHVILDAHGHDIKHWARKSRIHIHTIYRVVHVCDNIDYEQVHSQSLNYYN